MLGAHNHLFPRVAELLKEQGVDDVLIVGGGVIPSEDIQGLKDAGITEIFTPGAETKGMIEYIKNNLKR